MITSLLLVVAGAAYGAAVVAVTRLVSRRVRWLTERRVYAFCVGFDLLVAAYSARVGAPEPSPSRSAGLRA